MANPAFYRQFFRTKTAKPLAFAASGKLSFVNFSRMVALGVAGTVTMCGLVPIVFAAGAESSQEAEAPASSAGADGGAAVRIDADDRKGISLAMQAILDGNARYLARDYGGAVDRYRKAIQLSPRRTLAFYLMGEAELAAGNLAGAESSWAQAERMADMRDAGLRGRVLFVIADLKERQRKWDEARLAWQAYYEWTSRFSDAGVFPSSGTSRIQAIDAMLKQDKEYERVRQRIRETQDGRVFTDVDAGRAPSKK